MELHSRYRLSLLRVPLRITLFYVVLSLLWITLSDRLLAMLFEPGPTLVLIGTIKGWLYVAVSGAMIYLLTRGLLLSALKREEGLLRQIDRAHQNREAILGSLEELILTIDDQGRLIDTLGGRFLRAQLSPDEIARLALSVSRPAGGRYLPHEQTVILNQGALERVFTVTTAPFRTDASADATHLLVVREVTQERLVADERDRATRLLASVFGSSPMGIYVLDREGRVQLWNREAEECFGWSMGEVLNRPLPIVPEERRDEFDQLLDRALAGELVRGTRVKRRKKNGEEVAVRLTAAPLRTALDGEVNGVLVITEDLSQTVALEIERGKYDVLAEQIPDIVLVVDELGRIRDANRAAVEAYGYTVTNLRQMRIEDLRVRTPGAHTARADAPLSENGTRRFETTHRRRNGQTFPIEVSSSTFVVEDQLLTLKLIRDISARRRRDLLTDLIRQVDQGLLKGDQIGEILDRMAADLARGFGSIGVVVHRLQPAGLLEPVAVAGDQADPAFGALCEPCSLQSSTLVAQVARTQTVVGPIDGLRQVICLPLVAQGALIGTLTLSSSPGQPLPDSGRFALPTFSHQLAASLLQAQHQQQLRLLEAALGSTITAVMITDRLGHIQWVNQAFTALTGYTREEVLDETPRLLKSGVHPLRFYERLWDAIGRGEVWRGEVRNRRKDGTEYDEEMSITPVRDGRGQVTHFIAIKQDITWRAQAERRLAAMATTDRLTGLANRLGMEQQLERLLALMTPQESSVLAVIDLDQFMHVNEGFGYETGDRLLLDVAGVLQEHAGEGGLAARLGDDEFAVLLRGFDLGAALAWAQRVREAVGAISLEAKGMRVQPAISVGLAPLVAGIAPNQALLVAGQALATAKAAGGDRIEMVVSPAIQAAASANLAEWSSRIRTGLRSGQFELHYQPVVQLKSGRIDHYEALVRMRSGAGEVLAPGQFLGAAEKLHLMPLIDRWVFDAAVAQMDQRPELRLFINLSGQSLGESDFLLHVGHVIAANPHLARRLTFEITETTAVRNMAGVRNWMATLRSAGCRFALDDFGSGFSSFAYLRELPVDCVKIDGSFVRVMDTDLASQAMVRSVVEIAHTLGKSVVAEWVENHRIALLLQTMGVEFGQGFALGRPVPMLPDASD